MNKAFEKILHKLEKEISGKPAPYEYNNGINRAYSIVQEVAEGSDNMKLKDFQEKYHIRRIDFSKVKPTENDVEYASDKLICPYCKAENEYEAEETDEILKGTPVQCYNCDKSFYAEGEVTIDTTCTPIEDKVLEPLVTRNIKHNYEHMDICAEKGCEWDSPFGVVEYETYKQYAEPLFKNMAIDKESEE